MPPIVYKIGTGTRYPTTIKIIPRTIMATPFNY
jgi:hypothetical protein